MENIEIICRYTNRTQDEIYNILEQEASGLIEEIKRKIPTVGIRDTTGRLANCLKIRKVDDNTVNIYTDPEINFFDFLEYGTKPHDIYPRNAKALKFEVEGQTIFSKHVRHPGTRPYKPFGLAVEENRESIIKRVRSLVELSPEPTGVEG